MAVGYSFTSTVDALLEAGADAEAADSQGRTVLGLVESLRTSMPLSRDTMGRRIALEEVATLLASACPPCWAVWGVWLDVVLLWVGRGWSCCRKQAGRGRLLPKRRAATGWWCVVG